MLINFSEVYKSYDEKTVLQNVSFQVNEGETLGIIGFSGCGKSTTLKLISGLEKQDQGHIMVGDDNLAMVFQYSALFDSMTVEENILFPLIEGPIKRQKKYQKNELQDIVTEKLELVGLYGIENQYPSELSGGMKKRVSFARAIVTNPKIILYDEPTAGLDPVASTVIEDYIVCLKKKLNAASIIVTHQFSTINRSCDRLIMLHDGSIVWSGTPQELISSNDPYAIQFRTASVEGPMIQGIHTINR